MRWIRLQPAIACVSRPRVKSTDWTYPSYSPLLFRKNRAPGRSQALSDSYKNFWRIFWSYLSLKFFRAISRKYNIEGLDSPFLEGMANIVTLVLEWAHKINPFSSQSHLIAGFPCYPFVKAQHYTKLSMETQNFQVLTTTRRRWAVLWSLSAIGTASKMTGLLKAGDVPTSMTSNWRRFIDACFELWLPVNIQQIC